MRARRLARDAKRRALCLLHVGDFHKASLRHAIEHPIAAFDSAFALSERMIIARSFWQRCEVRRLGGCQLVYSLVEVGERCGCNAICAESEVNLIEIELKDLVLAVGPLDLQC